MSRRTFAASALLACAVAAVYLPVASAPFVFDDQFTVLENASLRSLWPLTVPLSPPRYFPTAGRPLVNLSLAVDYHFGALDPVGYHRTSFVLHAISACLLLGVAGRVLRALDFGARAAPAAFLVALLWALHPLQTEPVVYVTQRTELLMGAFHLATVYASIRHWTATAPRARGAWLAAAVASCFAGMASKESMVATPLLVLLLDRACFAGSLGAALRRSRALYAGLTLAWALLLFLNAGGPRADSAGFHLEVSPVAWWLTQAKVFWLYMKLAIWPWPLAIHYELPYLETLGAAWPWLLGLLALATGVGVALVRNRPAGVAGAWIFAMLAPPFLVPIVTEVAAERRMYLPLAASVSLAVAAAFRLAPDRRAAATALAAAGLALAACYAVVDRARLAAYRDELTLWSDTVARRPGSIAHTNFGLALARAGRRSEAQEQLERAVALRPRDAELHFNLANLLADASRTSEAIARYEAALALREEFPAAHTNLGAALAKAGRLDAALAHFERALALEPGSEAARRNLEQARAASARP